MNDDIVVVRIYGNWSLWDFNDIKVIFKLILVTGGFDISREIAFK